MNFWILRTGFTLAAPSTKWVLVLHVSDKIFVSTSVLLTLAAHLKITWGALFIYLFFSCGILAPWPGIKPVFTALEEYTLKHWTVREIPQGALEMSDAQEQPLKILKVVWGEDGHWLFLTNCLGNSLVHLGLIITALCKGLRSWWMSWLVDTVSVSCCCVRQLQKSHNNKHHLFMHLWGRLGSPNDSDMVGWGRLQPMGLVYLGFTWRSFLWDPQVTWGKFSSWQW